MKRKVLIATSVETGEQVLVTFEQWKAPQVAHPSPMDLFDLYVEEMEDEQTESDGNILVRVVSSSTL